MQDATGEGASYIPRATVLTRPIRSPRPAPAALRRLSPYAPLQQPIRILGRFAWPPWRRENGGAAVRDAVFTVMPMSSSIRMVLGTTDRNCRLLLEHAGQTL